jgi:hypothetical protein
MSPFRTWLAAVLAALSSSAVGSQDSVAQWTSVTLHTDVHDQPMVLTAQATTDHLSSIRIEHATRTFLIPVEAFAGIPSPYLNSIQVLSWVGEAIVPLPGVTLPPELLSPRFHFYVQLNFGPGMEVGEAPYPWSKMEFASVEFHFVNGEYRERWIHRPTGPDAWKLESDCDFRQQAARGKRCLLD